MMDPPPSAAHGRYRVFAAEEDAFRIDVHGLIPDRLFRGNGVIVSGMHDPGVVEDDIEAAKFSLGRGDHGFAVGRLGNVSRDRGRLASRLVDLGGDGCHRLMAEVDRHHLRAFGRKAERAFSADASRRAGDQGDFAFESHQIRSK